MGKPKLNETYTFKINIEIQFFSYIYWYPSSIFRISVNIEPGRSLFTTRYNKLFD